MFSSVLYIINCFISFMQFINYSVSLVNINFLLFINKGIKKSEILAQVVDGRFNDNQLIDVKFYFPILF